MTKKRHKRRRSILRSRFYRIYFALVALCLCLIALGARHLSAVLADYESAQPKYVAQQVAALFERGDYEDLARLDTSIRAVDEADRAYYIDRLKELTAGKSVSWSEAYSGKEDEKLYRVNLDGEKFAEFTLVPSGRRTQRGNGIWALKSVTSYVTVAQPTPTPAPAPTPAPVTCVLTVPSGSTVEVDGALLGQENIVEDGIATVPEGMLPEDAQAPTLTRYAFYRGEGAPEIRVTGANGKLIEAAQEGENVWACAAPQDAHPELQAQYEEYVVDVAKRIARFSVKDLSQASMLKFCAKDSPAYASISDFDNKWAKKPRSARFENISTGDFRMYGENCFSCHVSFDYIAKFKGKREEMTYPTAYTLYFVREGERGRLYSFTFS